METQAQVQEFYRQSATRYARYWLKFLGSQKQNDGTLDRELENIFAAFALAQEDNLHGILVQGVERVYPYCEARGLYAQIRRELLRARQAAESLADPAALARNALFRGRIAMRQEEFDEAEAAWRSGLEWAQEITDRGLVCALETELGVLATERRNYSQAETHLHWALALAQEIGATEQICVILGELCRAAFFQGQLEQAESYCRQALPLAITHGYTHRTTGLLVYLGIIEEARGNLAEARRHWEEGLALARQVGNLARISNLLVNLGMLANETGAWEEAETYLSEGLEVARRLGQSPEISHLLTDLGILYSQQGKRQQAEACLAESLQLARTMQNPTLLTYNLLKQGDFFLAQQEWQRAEECFVECTALQSSPNERDQEKVASAFWGLAQVEYARHNFPNAQRAAEQSLAIFERIGHHQAGQVREWLKKIYHRDTGDTESHGGKGEMRSLLCSQ
ncbi:MAG: tetratricopeptide repeat protein [Chloroflexi bacterium]|nr:tetratricopeptide repeat protein [Chloroflexota bacterium]